MLSYSNVCVGGPEWDMSGRHSCIWFDAFVVDATKNVFQIEMQIEIKIEIDVEIESLSVSTSQI